MNYRTLHIATWFSASFLFGLALLSSCPTAASAGQFDGFPAVNVIHPGNRSFSVLTSDIPQGMLRPQWTRAMTDIGGWPTMFRFGNDIYLEFNSVNAHKGTNSAALTGATGELIRYRSPDNGVTWNALPSWDPTRTVGEYVVAGNTLYRYEWDEINRRTIAQSSTDGVNFSAPQNVYQAPYWLWGATYDPATSTFWAAPHSMPENPDERQVHLIKSTDGFNWNYVSTVHAGDWESETALRVNEDGSLTALVRKKVRDRNYWQGDATSPFTNWQIADGPIPLEGHHFFEIGGQTFVSSRTYLSPYEAGEQVTADSNSLIEGYPTYSMIYKYTDDQQLVPWVILDSMGDNGYPFLIETPTSVLVAYYSQHEDKVSKVFLASFDRRDFLGIAHAPEPSSLVLLGVGALTLVAGRVIRRRRAGK